MSTLNLINAGWPRPEEIKSAFQLLSSTHCRNASSCINRVAGGVGSLRCLLSLYGDKPQGKKQPQCCYSVWPSEDAVPTWRVPFGILYIAVGLFFTRYSGGSMLVRLAASCASCLADSLSSWRVMNTANPISRTMPIPSFFNIIAKLYNRNFLTLTYLRCTVIQEVRYGKRT